uniref:C-type lectin domain-containing protein n=1 Tax=Amphiprion percula TaxID=161767 RepID=A0A3P8TIB9_AMPPE
MFQTRFNNKKIILLTLCLDNPRFCVFLTGWLILPTCSLHQYYFIKEPLTWNEAQTYCRQKYTDLATMENADDLNQLQRLLSSSGHNYEVWFGLYSKINWKWSDGFTGSGAEYRDWGTNEPHFQMDHFCVYKYTTWSSYNCDSELKFSCYTGKDIKNKIIYCNLK